MDKPSMARTVLQFSHVPTTYNEQETILASHLGSGSLRYFRVSGLISGKKAGKEWLYSEEEIAQLRRIRRLQHDLGVNLAGVEVILHLLKQLEAVQRALDEEKHKHEH